jgi:asparagine synthase (glutamine-hydrolysing)
MQSGFTVECSSEDLTLKIYGPPQPGPRSLVGFVRRDGCCLVLMGRLYYREELREGLPTPRGPAAADADADLALAAYLDRGVAGIERLEGDYSLVLWDGRERLLLGSRDAMGGFPLFWVRTGGRVVLGTGLRPLVDRLPARRLNLDYLAEHLMLPRADMQEPPGEGCVYEGVRRLPVGSLIAIRLPHGRVEQRTCFDWLDRVVDPGTDRLEELAEQLSDVFRPAVWERVRGRTAAQLSGGMDSSCVALVARDWLEWGGGERPLHTISVVHRGHPAVAPETPYIAAALAGQPGLRAHRLSGDALAQYNALLAPPAHDEPCSALLSMGIDRATTAAAASVGAETLLTGLGGDEVADVPPYHIADLLRAGRVAAAWGEARRWGAATNGGARGLFRRFGIGPVLPGWLRGGLGAALHGGRVSWLKQAEGTVPPWIRRGFARDQQLHRRALEHVRSSQQRDCPAGVSALLASIRARAGEGCRRFLGAPEGIMIAHPFLDPRVICLALGIRTRFRQSPGRTKPLLAEAMRGVLPEKIRRRERNGRADASRFAGLAENLPALETMIRHSPVDDLEILDKRVLVDCLRRAAAGVGHSPAGALRLGTTLSLLAWLSQEGRQEPLPPPTETIHVARGDEHAYAPPTVPAAEPVEGGEPASFVCGAGA